MPVDVLIEIQEKMASNDKFVFIHRGEGNEKYLQYKPAAGNDDDWAQGACHYEFRIDKGRLQVCFHCESKFEYQLKFKELLVSREQSWFAGLKVWVQRNKSWIVYDEDNKEMDAERAIAKMIEFRDKYGEKILELIEDSKKENSMVNQIGSVTEVLRQKKNIILQGAPGTGKTYKTAALALSILGESGIDLKDHAAVMKKYNELLIEFDEKGKIKNDGQIGFVTFHQSMDYEDFVEGIKPRTTNEQVTYDVESGIFKSLCTKAKPKYEDSVDNFEDIWKRLVDELDEKGKIPVPLLKGTSTFDIELNEYGDGLATRTYLEGKDDWERGRSKFFSKDQLYRVYQNLPGIPSGGHDNYRKAIIKELKKNYGLLEFKKGTQEGSSLKNYVLIIDEINRGNVSKIFGELISLLETDKRVGGDHPLSVTLPYSKEPFSVPSNLYIIGTMNTTDRSVGSIDYAVRRRFAFVTLEADESAIENYYKGKDESLKNKAIELFGKVKDLLSNKDNRSNDMEFEDLMVGHSYFMAKTIEELELKWKYEVVPLLKEYQKDGLLRHSAKIDDLLK